MSSIDRPDLNYKVTCMAGSWQEHVLVLVLVIPNTTRPKALHADVDDDVDRSHSNGSNGPLYFTPFDPVPCLQASHSIDICRSQEQMEEKPKQKKKRLKEAGGGAEGKAATTLKRKTAVRPRRVADQCAASKWTCVYPS